MHAKGSLDEAVRLLSLAASLPVDRGLLEVLGRAAAAAMSWQDGAAALLPGPGGLPSRRGVMVDDVHELIREGKALPFRCVGCRGSKGCCRREGGWWMYMCRQARQGAALQVRV
jgi:hypothetical protein